MDKIAMPTDRQYLQRCIDLAQFSQGHHAPNPKVGAVIVHQGRIIGEGFHEKYGQAHAEVNAVNSVSDKSLLKESTIYVSLEPCHHHGKTPPCVDLILQHQFPRVVIGIKDPYEEVAGKSIEKLRKAGVEVVTGLLDEQMEELNRRFLTAVCEQRPFVVLKYAISADGFMGQAGQNISISNAISKRLVHRWRAEESAVLVGTNTAQTDNPQLGNRLYFGPQPLRLVLDRQLRLPAALQLFDGQLDTLVFTERVAPFERKGVAFAQISFEQNKMIPAILAELHRRNIQSLLVEGGAMLLQSFLDSSYWDEVRVLRADKRLGTGLQAPLPAQRHLWQQLPLGNNRLEIYQQEG